MIVGIDEVGRGAWAGPLAVGAVLLGGAEIDGLTDSKRLTKSQRVALDQEIRMKARGVGIGWVSAHHVDALGLTAALKVASARALSHIRHEYNEIIIDGNVSFIDDPRVTLMKKADLLVPSVSAASIVAKVARDNYMKHVGKVFPGYRFASHVGYGTAMHQHAIKEKGVTPIHRLSYAPLQHYVSQLGIAKQRLEFRPGQRLMSDVSTTKQIGDKAEALVAHHLEFLGHEILARNWRTKYCEIDIVSKRGDTLYFTEVKYRKDHTRGGGLAAITTKKQRQMFFAADFYAVKNGFAGHNLRLMAAGVSGRPLMKVDEMLELG